MGRLLVLGSIAAIVLALSVVTVVAAPSRAEGAELAFRSCMLETPVPRRPAPFLTQDPAAKARAIRLMEFEMACARSSGIDTVPGMSLYQQCIGGIPAHARTAYRLASAMDCGRAIGGMFISQVEMASGYNVSPLRTSPISTVKRFPHLEQHVREGTWWWQICG